MSFNYKDFQFQFTTVEPPAIDLYSSSLLRAGAKYVTVSHDVLHSGSQYRGVMDEPVKNLIDPRRPAGIFLQAEFAKWCERAAQALNVQLDSFSITTRIDAPIFKRAVKLPNVRAYSEWLLQNAIKASSAHNTSERWPVTSRLSYGCGKGLRFGAVLDPQTVLEFKRCLTRPAGISGQTHAGFILKATAAANGFDPFVASHHEPWRMELTVGSIKPLPELEGHLAAA